MDLQKIYSDSSADVIAFAESRIGGRRENQDSFGWNDTRLGYLVTVCDGMGGGPGGKTASTIAVKEIVDSITDASEKDDPKTVVADAVRRANDAIIEAGKQTPQFKGMGSTATVLLIGKQSAIVAHVGDSRIYQLRRGRKVFRTFDHSMVFEMVKQKVITEEQARLSAQSNIITRALGAAETVDVEIAEVAYEKGDRFMLCSDGIHGTMPEKELLKLVSKRSVSLATVTDDIATHVDNLGHNAGGGHDNLTLALVETRKYSKLTPKMTKAARIIIAVMLMGLTASIMTNVMQYRTANAATKATADSIALYKDSVKKSQAAVATLTDSIKKITKNK